jgi:ankyrin repeat protein
MKHNLLRSLPFLLSTEGKQRMFLARNPMNAGKLLLCGLLLAVSFRSYGKGGTNQVIFAAAEQGDVALLQQIFATNINALPLRNSLLRTAANSGQKQVVEFLIAQGADVNDKGSNFPPLANMAMYGTTNDEKCVEVATVLLAHGAEVDPVDYYGGTPLFHAVEVNKPKLARLLLEHGANPATTRKGTYLSPLLMAVRAGHLEMAKLLLDFKAPTDISDPDGHLPLLAWAVQRRNHELVRLLVEHGATISPPRTMPPQEWNPTMVNVDRVYPLQSYNIDRVPLFMAIRMRDPESLSLLLRSNAPVDAVDENGDAALHWAVRTGDTNLVNVLLNAKPRIDLTNYGGATPLFVAQAAENKVMVELLRRAAAARGVTLAEIAAPSREDMRSIARRICDGDLAALNELDSAAQEMYRNDSKQEARRRLNYDRMDAAFKMLAEEAGKGNKNAIQTLKTCLDRGDLLKGFAPDALGIAAAAGNEESLTLLLRFRDWNILENTAAFALAAPAKANKEPAVDFFVTLALDPQSVKHQYYGVSWLVKDVLQTSVTNGNPKAKDALDKFLAASAN